MKLILTVMIMVFFSHKLVNQKYANVIVANLINVDHVPVAMYNFKIVKVVITLNVSVLQEQAKKCISKSSKKSGPMVKILDFLFSQSVSTSCQAYIKLSFFKMRRQRSYGLLNLKVLKFMILG